MYTAAARGSMVLYQWALDVWEAPLMYLPVISPLRLRLVPSRLLVPIAALQILWAHLMKLLSLKDKEQGRQIKRFPAPIRQRALIRGRGKSLLQEKVRVNRDDTSTNTLVLGRQVAFNNRDRISINL